MNLCIDRRESRKKPATGCHIELGFRGSCTMLWSHHGCHALFYAVMSYFTAVHVSAACRTCSKLLGPAASSQGDPLRGDAGDDLAITGVWGERQQKVGLSTLIFSISQHTFCTTQLAAAAIAHRSFCF